MKMKILLDKDKEFIVNNVTIVIGDTEFKITTDRFGGITIQKEEYGEGQSGLIIKPNVSNVINIS